MVHNTSHDSIKYKSTLNCKYLMRSSSCGMLYIYMILYSVGGVVVWVYNETYTGKQNTLCLVASLWGLKRRKCVVINGSHVRTPILTRTDIWQTWSSHRAVAQKFWRTNWRKIVEPECFSNNSETVGKAGKYLTKIRCCIESWRWMRTFNCALVSLVWIRRMLSE